MKWIDRTIAALFVVGVLGIVLANPDPLARDALCRLAPCWMPPQHPFWGSIGYDLAIGTVTSIIFYWLLVSLPDARKRARLKRHLAASYKSFRKEIVTQLLFASTNGRSVSLDTRDELVPMDAFRSHFKSDSHQVKGSKWDDVANGMTDSIRHDLGVTLSLLRDDIAFVLNTADIADEEAFALLYNLQKVVGMVLLNPSESDEDTNILNLLWQLMAGWDWVEGYPKKDRVQALIDRI